MNSRAELIKETLKLAEKGRGLVSPNPMVGAVIVRGSHILGRGWHKAFGLPHAEIEALREAGKRAKGATLYVNLEPCCHYGKTPPCTEAIIKAGIKEVVCSMKDPNPLVDGKGIEILEKNGVKVRTGILQEEAEELNSAYITYITKKRPYIILKWAQTLDGRTATYNGDSKWITSEGTRDFVKKVRFEMDGILVGINTILKDNPSLDYILPSFQTQKDLLCRKRYHKIILDPSLKTPSEGRWWENTGSRVLLVVSESVQEEKVSAFTSRDNSEVIRMPCHNNRFSLSELSEKLYEKGMGIIMVEGGSKTLTYFWEEKMVDEVMVFTGNKILGGKNSLPSIGGENRETFSQSVRVQYTDMKRLDDDYLIRGKPCFQG
jgi:diaminohydroxyphosphoribosylaminopyrimidine deaminase / 5-amino-6-(5-phosphoribosylamino)uracil reductase